MFDNIWDKEPDAVNELGVKWWKDVSTTDYAQKPDAKGTVLMAECWFVEEPDGNRTRLLISDTEILEEEQSLEAMGVKIDLRKVLLRAEK